MRLLVVSDTPFLPATAGNRQRIAQLVGWLAEHGVEPGLVMLPAVDRAEWDVEGMRQRVARLTIAEPPPRWTPERLMAGLRWRAAQLVPSLAAASPGLDDRCPSWFRRRVLEEVAAWRPDVVMVEYVYLSACLVGLARLPEPPRTTVIDTLDVMHQRRAAYAAAAMPPQWFHISYEEERRGLARADLVLAIEDGEADVFRTMVPADRVLVVPHAFPMATQPPARAERVRLLFVASYNDLNVHGLEWFLEAVWPALREAQPTAELHVCGSVGEKLGAVPLGVHVRGVVDALRAEYAAARVVIDPVRSGTGFPTKVAEALCHGRPVVSVHGAALRLRGERVAGAVAGGSAADFIAGVLRLLDDAEAWRREVADGTAFAGRHLSPDAALGPLLDRLRRA